MASESTRQPLRGDSGQPPRENPLTSTPINTLLARLAIPSIIAMLVSAPYDIVNQFFIDRSVDILDNATTNMAFPLTITCTVVLLMCRISGSANFNLSMGQGDRKEAKRCASNAVFMSFAIGIILCLAVRSFLSPMMILFGATLDVLGYSFTYTGITSLGFPFLILSTGGSDLIRAGESPRYSIMCTLTGAVISTILDPLLISGFNVGVAGVVLATIMGQFVPGLMVIDYLARFKTVHLSLHSLKPIPSYLKAIAVLGITPFLNQMATMVVQIVMDSVLRHCGAQSHYGSEVPLACADIITKVDIIFFFLIIGLSQGLQSIISFNYGAEKYSRVREAYLKAVCIATAISVFAFLCFQLIPRQIMSIFGSGNEEYFYFAEEHFRIFLFFTFIDGLQPITADLFTSVGKAAKGIFISLIRQIVFPLPLIITLPVIFGIEGVMFSVPVAGLVAAVLAATFVVRELRYMKHLPE